MNDISTVGALSSNDSWSSFFSNSIGQTSLIIIGAICLFTIVAWFKLYQKMGEPGWVCLIPFYNTWVMCKHVWGHGAVSLMMLIPVINTVIGAATTFMLFRNFQKSVVFSVLITLLFSPIGYLICAFDSSEYTQPQNISL